MKDEKEKAVLDTDSVYVLSVINDGCGRENAYKIFTREDFVSARAGFTKEILSACIARLSEGGYIAVKYDGRGLYCIRPTFAGRNYGRAQEEKILNERTSLKNGFLTAFFGAFSGAVLGGVLVFLAFVIVRG